MCLVEPAIQTCFSTLRAYEGLGKPRYRSMVQGACGPSRLISQQPEADGNRTNWAAKGQSKQSKRELDEKVLLALKPVELQSRGTRWLKWGLIGVAGTSLTVATLLVCNTSITQRLGMLRMMNWLSSIPPRRIAARLLHLTGLGLLTGGLAPT